MSDTLGLYVHVPFCRSKCLYCDFCSFPRMDREAVSAYVDEVCRRMIDASAQAAKYTVDTVYFGGGTPTLLPISAFSRLLDTIRKHYSLSEDCEITAECNPATADFAYLSALRALGVNRLSIGLQSAHENELRALGRAHTFADFVAVFADARRAGFDNISADLMYGIPHQTIESFRASLEALCELSPEHISAYGLKIEEGTPFFSKKDALPLPDEDTEYHMYQALSHVLCENGYHKYEISNFAKEGRHSRHNLRYWHGEEYLGFGVAAHSYFGGVRFGNSRDMNAFLRGEDITEERICLSAHEQEEEFVMLALRLAEGISKADFLARTGEDFEARYPTVRRMIAGGFMKDENGRIAFTDEGFFVSNAILAEMLDFEEPF